MTLSGRGARDPKSKVAPGVLRRLEVIWSRCAPLAQRNCFARVLGLVGASGFEPESLSRFFPLNYAAHVRGSCPRNLYSAMPSFFSSS